MRRVSRVLHHIDPWSAFKVAALFSLVSYVVLLTAGVMLWRVADSTGTIANVERWFTQFGWETLSYMVMRFSAAGDRAVSRGCHDGAAF